MEGPVKRGKSAINPTTGSRDKSEKLNHPMISVQTDRQTGRQSVSTDETDSTHSRQTGRQMGRQTGRQTDRQSVQMRQTKHTAYRQTDRQADRQTGRQAPADSFARLSVTCQHLQTPWQRWMTGPGQRLGTPAEQPHRTRSTPCS